MFNINFKDHEKFDQTKRFKLINEFGRLCRNRQTASAPMMATVVKDLSLILVEGRKKSTPRYACLAALLNLNPG